MVAVPQSSGVRTPACVTVANSGFDDSKLARLVTSVSPAVPVAPDATTFNCANLPFSMPPFNSYGVQDGQLSAILRLPTGGPLAGAAGGAGDDGAAAVHARWHATLETAKATISDSAGRI